MARTLMALLAAVALLVAGCGGGSDGKAEYVRQLDRAEAKLDRALTGIRKDVVPGTPISVIATKLDEGASALDQAARDFRAIHAPADARAEQHDIVVGVQELAAVYRRSAAAARRNDVPRLTHTLRNLQESPAAQRIRRAQQALQRKGYKIRTG